MIEPPKANARIETYATLEPEAKIVNCEHKLDPDF